MFIPTLIEKGVPAGMVALGMALTQEAVTTIPEGWASLGSALGQALITGGGLAVVGTFLLKRITKYLDDRAIAATEERNAERLERERQYADHKDTTTRYITSLETRVQLTEERYDRLIGHLWSQPPAVTTYTGGKPE